MHLIYIEEDKKLYKLEEQQYLEYFRRKYATDKLPSGEKKEIYSPTELKLYVVMNGFQVPLTIL